MTKTYVSLLAAGLVAAAGMAWAGDPMTIGQVEFNNSCAQCHGPTGMGDGPMAGVLKNGAPDLTGMQAANGGVFPVAQIYKMISGQGLSGAHGSDEMPAWGFRYSIEAPSQLGPYYSKADEQALVEGRILALVEYIASLQKN
ncbi:c-type cytochrome [Acidimangrovimonas pyrenivorans]|uniref:C-type cytochrome n=1 Tax=Acidimangrovimonas pyrenivorans TaxID=2030798 RepID=A0ABV7AM41_9RHOB